MSLAPTLPLRRPALPGQPGDRPALLRILTLLALALVALALAGCQTNYLSPDAARLASDQRATLQVEGNLMGLTLTRLDGLEINRNAGTRVEMAPGKHVVAANLNDVASDPFILEFTAEAGHHYVLDSSIVDRNDTYVFRWIAEITEAGSRRVVSQRPDGATAPLWGKR